MEITGRIKKIYAERGSWASFQIVDDDGNVCHAAGNINGISIGLKVRLTGEYQNTQYGLQFKINKAELIQDNSKEGLIAYLSSGFIKGIGAKRARLIVERFGNDTTQIIENCPEKLADISGITPKKAIEISTAYNESKEYLRIIELLGGDATMYQVKKIFEKYGKDSVKKLKENPYMVIYELDGFGFKKADVLAAAMGIKSNDKRRIAAAITYTLKSIAAEGHCFCRIDSLESCLNELLGNIEISNFADILAEEINAGHLVLEDDKIYMKNIWFCENESAKIIAALVKSKPQKSISEAQAERVIRNFSQQTGFELETKQKEAINLITKNRFCVITGGPGTGKSTIIKGIIDLWNDEKHTLLVAPTGRAAKRMADLTGKQSSTIHRLLLDYEHHSSIYDNFKALVIADEASMLDISLAYKLLKFVIKTNSSLILIGDIYQLPPIGAGNFFRDVVKSPCVPTVSLELSFRQSGKIATNANRINAGEGMNAYNYDETFKFVPADKNNMQSKIIEEYMALYKQYPIEDICCITPIRKDSKNNTRLTSANALNVAIRQIVNPEKPGEKHLKGCSFRIGDRVMQIVNDSKKMVMNGDCGIVRDISEDDNLIFIAMDDGRTIEYTPAETAQLVLAYAMTVHKSQGSEYKAVIMVQGWEHYKMLQRTLLYTGVTRAKEKVVLVGESRAINLAVRTIPNIVRNTQLRTKIGKEVSL